MIETFAALLLAHLIADFILQSGAMARQKTRPALFLGHALIVAASAWVMLGLPITTTALVVLGALTVAHMLIDALKSGLGGDGIGAFLADQAAHLLTLAIAARLVPGLWDGGHWDAVAGWIGTGSTTGSITGSILSASDALILLAGAIAATRVGQFVVQKTLETIDTPPPVQAQPPTAQEVGKLLFDGKTLTVETRPAVASGPRPQDRTGRLIGWLERAITFCLVLSGLASGIAFLIAAKSILRFGTVKDDPRAAEIVLIGTLASIGWAILMAMATLIWLTEPARTALNALI